MTEGPIELLTPERLLKLGLVPASSKQRSEGLITLISGTDLLGEAIGQDKTLNVDEVEVLSTLCQIFTDIENRKHTNFDYSDENPSSINSAVSFLFDRMIKGFTGADVIMNTTDGKRVDIALGNLEGNKLTINLTQKLQYPKLFIDQKLLELTNK